jgi:hypothetical protein
VHGACAFSLDNASRGIFSVNGRGKMAKVFRCDRCNRFHDKGGYDTRPTVTVRITETLSDGEESEDIYDSKTYELCRNCAALHGKFLAEGK